MSKIDWEKVWETFDEWNAQDEMEGKPIKTSELRHSIELIVEKQLRLNNP